MRSTRRMPPQTLSEAVMIAFRCSGLRLLPDRFPDRVRELPRRRDAHGRGGRIVFGLGEQIGRDEVRIRGAVGENDDFARAGDHVDVAHSENLALGLGHVQVARTHDLVHLRDAFGPVGEGGHGLGAADPVDFVESEHGGRGQYRRVHGSLRVRAGETTAISLTPATCAGITAMSREEG